MGNPVATNRATYDVIAPEFDEQTKGNLPYLVAAAADFARELGPGTRVADVGCGPGRDTAELRGYGLVVAGLDLSMGMLRAAGVGGLAQADMRALPLADASVDGIWCQAAFLHIPKVDAAGVIGEFARVVKPVGVLHLAVQEGDGEGWETVDYAPAYRRWFVSYGEDELRAHLGRHGFTVGWVLRPGGRRNWLLLRAFRGRQP